MEIDRRARERASERVFGSYISREREREREERERERCKVFRFKCLGITVAAVAMFARAVPWTRRERERGA